MAFSFTYKSLFKKKDFRRAWLGRDSRDRTLLLTSWVGALVVHALVFIAAWEFPPSASTVRPVIVLGGLDALPLSFLTAVFLFVFAWVADEYPKGSRITIVIFSVIYMLVYPFVVFSDADTFVDVRMLFIIYFFAMAALAWGQFKGIDCGESE